jgi:hypothetical protein
LALASLAPKKDAVSAAAIFEVFFFFRTENNNKINSQQMTSETEQLRKLDFNSLKNFQCLSGGKKLSPPKQIKFPPEFENFRINI